jgi:hypothetical protein
VGPPAGQEASTPFQLASVIVVHTSDSTHSAYQKLATLLLEQGYHLQETEPAQGLLTTDYGRSAYRRIKVSLHFVISAHTSGSLIEERAIGQVSVAASRFAVACRGTPIMPIACAWSEMYPSWPASTQRGYWPTNGSSRRSADHYLWPWLKVWSKG